MVSWILGDEVVVSRGGGDHPGRAVHDVPRCLTGEFDDEPRASVRERREALTSPARPHRGGNPGIHPLDRGRPEAKQRGNGIGSCRDVGVAQDDQAGCYGKRHQVDGRGQGQRARPLATDECTSKIRPVFREEVLEPVAGHLSSESIEALSQELCMSSTERGCCL